MACFALASFYAWQRCAPRQHWSQREGIAIDLRLPITLDPPVISNIAPIGQVMLGDASLASKMADAMLEQNIYVIGFSYPVVPEGKVRSSLSPVVLSKFHRSRNSASPATSTNLATSFSSFPMLVAIAGAHSRPALGRPHDRRCQPGCRCLYRGRQGHGRDLEREAAVPHGWMQCPPGAVLGRAMITVNSEEIK